MSKTWSYPCRLSFSLLNLKKSPMKSVASQLEYQAVRSHVIRKEFLNENNVSMRQYRNSFPHHWEDECSDRHTIRIYQDIRESEGCMTRDEETVIGYIWSRTSTQQIGVLVWARGCVQNSSIRGRWNLFLRLAFYNFAAIGRLGLLPSSKKGNEFTVVIT